MRMESYSDKELDLLLDKKVLQDLDANSPPRTTPTVNNQGSRGDGDAGGSQCQGLTAGNNLVVSGRETWLSSAISQLQNVSKNGSVF